MKPRPGSYWGDATSRFWIPIKKRKTPPESRELGKLLETFACVEDDFVWKHLQFPEPPFAL